MAPEASKNRRGAAPIFEKKSNCKGRQPPRTKAIPDAAPISRACWRWKAKANETRAVPPSKGPRPKSKETKKPEASSELNRSAKIIKSRNETHQT